MSRVLAAIEDDGAKAFRVFPRESGVLLAFAERIASDVVSKQSSHAVSDRIIHGRGMLMCFALDAHIPLHLTHKHSLMPVRMSGPSLGLKDIRIRILLARACKNNQYTPFPVSDCRML